MFEILKQEVVNGSIRWNNAAIVKKVDIEDVKNTPNTPDGEKKLRKIAEEKFIYLTV